MGNRLILLVIAGIISLISSPTILTAADSVEVTGLDTAGVVETVPEPEPEPATEVAYVPAAPAAGYVTTVAAPQVANYTVTAYTGSIEVNPSYSDIYKTNKLVYGHNSGALLGSLANRYVGEEFMITEGGVAYNYRVADIVVYEKTADGYLNGNARLMGTIMRTAMGHSIALMTCAGQMLGGGDATHRLVVYADAI